MSLANRILEECGSTNDVARRLAEEGHPHGTWVAARRQTQGRGRQGRVWSAPEGNLSLSMVVRLQEVVSEAPVPPALWGWIPLAVAVALTQAVAALEPSLQLAIKWPNDLLLDGKKCGGILCEASLMGARPYVVAGLGLNLRETPEEWAAQATALGLKAYSLEEVQSECCAALLRIFEQLRGQGSEPLRCAYKAVAWLKPGASLRWGSGEGQVHGLGEDGALWVRERATQVLRALYAEEVHLS